MHLMVTPVSAVQIPRVESWSRVTSWVRQNRLSGVMR
jgi:hypothetical protein